MSESAHLESFQLGRFTVPRLWNGLWQLSSNAWGSAPAREIKKSMEVYAQRGYTAFDMVSLLPPTEKWRPYSLFPMAALLSTHTHTHNHPDITRETQIRRCIGGSLWQLGNSLCERLCLRSPASLLRRRQQAGQFRNARAGPEKIVGATKWCVFDEKTVPTFELVSSAVKERLDRMQSPSIDLLQFHWQHYNKPGYIDALRHLVALSDKGGRGETKISEIGLCNFDSERMDEICTELGPGVIVSNQVQFSLIDQRPRHAMAAVCKKHNVKLLTYGTLAGGLLSDEWLGKPEPHPYTSIDKPLTPSQRKYLDMIKKGWSPDFEDEQEQDEDEQQHQTGDSKAWLLFQELLRTLKAIGERHGGVTIANVATRWVLDHEFVGAVIVGTRMGITDHCDSNARVSQFSLTDADHAQIHRVLGMAQDPEHVSRQTFRKMGDCGAEYRMPERTGVY
ncbi:hypothetical protein EIP91_009245 [Steccherinum ochraceum]|uniref:NADP-dependent oxidoreductase domain-containing protein n=1 Tax=Steccherinum ochraceum TaxID=92696 RepID=A0A4R0REW7_9APHY|nr:hypothetical protein EIP91_009245 [Steccherinum ochraceum]